MNVGVYASTCIHFMYTDVYTWLYICLYAVEFQRAERNGQALGITREQLTTLRPAGIAQWQKPRTWSSKSVPIYWPPKKFGWIFSIDAQTTLRTFRCVDCWLVEWKEGWDLFFPDKGGFADRTWKVEVEDETGWLCRRSVEINISSPLPDGSGYCQSTWRVRGRSGWILWHLVLDHFQEWCMWDDLPEGVEWVWQVCPSVGGSLMGAGYSWGPWRLIHHPEGTMRQMFPKKADLLKNNEFLRFLKIHSGCPKLFQQWWNLMIGWRQCLPLNILRIPKRPIYFPYDLGFIMGSVWERGSHFLGAPAISLCFDGSWNSWQLLPLWIQIWTNGNSRVYDSWFSFGCTPFL